MARFLVMGLLVLLLCGVVAAINEFTLQVNGVDYQNLNNPTFIWGDIIRFSGSANKTTDDGVYIVLRDENNVIDWTEPKTCRGLTFGSTIRPIKIQSDNLWSYEWNTGDTSCKYPNVDALLGIDAERAMFPITMKAIVTSTPTPTPDYSAKISVLENRVLEQETKIATQATQIQQVESRVKTFGEIMAEEANATQTVTPSPTQTVNYESTIAAMQTQLAQQQTQMVEQGSWIDQILRFLGLK